MSLPSFLSVLIASWQAVTSRHYPGENDPPSTAQLYHDHLWIPPRFHEWHSGRATRRSILLAWDAASHPFDQVRGYEVQVRHPIPSSLGKAEDLTDRLREASLWHRRQGTDGSQTATEIYQDVLERRPHTGNLSSWDGASSLSLTATYTVDERVEWSQWQPIFIGPGRVFNWEITEEVCEGCSYEFRIRAVGLRQGDSPWSIKTLLAHTIRPGAVDRAPFEIIGSGRNNAGWGSLSVNGEVIFRRSTERGLLLVVLDRHNLHLLHMRM
ncbi:hypothetical protein FOZ62_029668 [Perkinsus olseni]|uniref:Uncharacterized protein n=1 Tax=Perkinsus olseni TaxID=32597 RepID=A0A7J6U7Q2_PEROL|nr:hypothetical protein FOZ62_029668 [Perkinsus olseni]